MERMWTLDGLRGLAAISVVVYHGLYWRNDVLIVSAGKYAVYLFFILSAMTLTKVYANRFRLTLDASSVITFYRNRIARILPLLAAVAVLNFAFNILRGADTFDEFAKFVLTATGTFGFGVVSELSNTVGAWSLAIEAVFYLLFPIVCILAQNATLRQLVVTSIGLNILQLLYNIYILNNFSPDQYWPFYTMPLSFCAYFSWGVVLGRLPQIKSRFSWIGVPIVLSIIWVSAFGPEDEKILLAWPGAAFIPFTLMTCVYLVYIWDRPIWVLPACRFLGEISYGVYLLHPLVYFILTRFVPATNMLSTVEFLTLFISVSLMCAFFSHCGFEQPMRRFLRCRYALVRG